MIEVADKTKFEEKAEYGHEECSVGAKDVLEPPKEYKSHNMTWRRIKWNPKAVMYGAVNRGYEVHKYVSRHRNEFVLPEGKKRRTKLTQGYILPEDEDFGKRAWHWNDKDLAEKKFEELSNE